MTGWLLKVGAEMNAAVAQATVPQPRRQVFEKIHTAPPGELQEVWPLAPNGQQEIKVWTVGG